MSKYGRKSANKTIVEDAATEASNKSMEATLKELLPEVPDPGNKNVSAKLDFLTKLLCAVAKMVQDVQHSCQIARRILNPFRKTSPS